MKRNIFVLVLALGAAAYFQGWFLGLTWETLWAKRSDHSLVMEYTRALASGHSYLLTPPDPRVLADPDPRRSRYLLLDASLYRGRYYLYFGVVPFLILLLPWLAATGTFLPAPTAILLFSLSGYAAYCGTLLVVARRLALRIRATLAGIVFVGLIASSGTWPLMGRPAIYELENVAAYALFGWAVFVLALAEISDRKRPKLMAATALAGLAFGCRPNIFPAVAVLTLYALYRSLNGRDFPGSRAVRLACTLLPLALVGLGLACWNYHRFDNPMDFGVKQFSQTSKETGLLFTSVHNVPYNAERYFMGTARLGGYFPFIEGQGEGHFKPVPNQEPSNQVYGFLIVSPFLLWALLLPFAARHLRAPDIAIPATALVLASFGNLFYLSLIGFSCYRYPADFLGPIGLLAGIGVLRMDPLGPGWRRWLLFPSLCLTVAWSVCWAVLESTSIAQVHSLFDLQRPEDFRLLAKPFNAVAYRIERLEGGGPRALRLDLRFPAGKSGHVEPLVVTGTQSAQDFLYAYYTSPETIQFGFESMGYGGRVTGPIAMDYGAPHSIDVFLGTFLPPDDHPLLAEFSKADLALSRRTVRVSLDGHVVMEGTAVLHPVRSRIFIGESPDDPAFGKAFQGEMISTHRPLLNESLLRPDWSADMFGPLTLVLRIAPMASGLLEPLLSVGCRPTGGMLALEHLNADEICIDWNRYGQKPLRSAPVRLPPGVPHRLEFTAGSLYPPEGSALWKKAEAASQLRRKRDMVCSIDGQVLMDLKVETPDTSPHELFIGRNTVGMSEVSQTFSGSIVSSTREPW